MEGAMRDATERDRQRGRQRDRQRDRQTGRQADRQTDRQTEKERETEKAIMFIKQAFLKLNKCSLNKKSDAVQIDLG